MSAEWHFHPDLPLKPVPYWLWPPRPVTILKWLFQNFLLYSDRAFYIAYSFAVAFWLMPFTPAEAVMSWDWPLLVVLRNYVAVTLVVGGLHVWFYGIDAQGNRLR